MAEFRVLSIPGDTGHPAAPEPSRRFRVLSVPEPERQRSRLSEVGLGEAQFEPAYPGDVPASAWTPPVPSLHRRAEEPESTGIEAARMTFENIPAQARQVYGGGLRFIGESIPTSPIGVQARTITRAREELPPEQRTLGAIRRLQSEEQARTFTPEELAAEPLAAYGADVQARATEEVQANQPNLDPWSAKGIAYNVGQGIISTAPTVAVALATRSPAAGLAVMGAQTGGQKYGESRAEGRTPEQARMDAGFTAAAETIPETIPLGFLMKQGWRPLKRMLMGAVGEGGQEVVTEALEAAYDVGVLDKDMTWGQALDRIAQAGVAGAGTGFALGAAAHPFVR